MKTKLSLICAAVLGLGGPVSSVAHHSHGNYELHDYTHLSGTVREVLWINPHAWINLEVDNADGTTTNWALEGGGINALTRRGWKQDDIQAGDTISVRCHRLRDGAPGCLLGYITTENGEEKEWD